METSKLAQKRDELLEKIEQLAKKRGIAAIRDTALLNAKNYAREQLQYGHNHGKTEEELEIESLERHLHSQEASDSVTSPQ